jgi:endonuclease/exonuclease/phosphatase family metal-dependent hydrolase
MDSPIRLLTLNLFLRPPGIHTNYSDYKDLRTEVFVEDFLQLFDIVCLQEVFGTFNYRKDRILKEAEKKGFFHYGASNPDMFKGHLIDSGLVILSKFEIVDKDEFTFTVGKGVDGLCSKGVLYAKIKLPNNSVHVFTTHLQASYHTEDLKKFMEYRDVRKIQLIELKKFVDKKVSGCEEPVFIAGDFNVDGRELRKILRFKVEEEYKDFFKILSGEDQIIE